MKPHLRITALPPTLEHWRNYCRRRAKQATEERIVLFIETVVGDKEPLRYAEASISSETFIWKSNLIHSTNKQTKRKRFFFPSFAYK